MVQPIVGSVGSVFLKIPVLIHVGDDKMISSSGGGEPLLLHDRAFCRSVLVMGHMANLNVVTKRIGQPQHYRGTIGREVCRSSCMWILP